MSESESNSIDKKIKFRSISTTADPNYALNRVEEIYLPRPRSKSEQKYKLLKPETPAAESSGPSLLQFLKVELTRGYILEHDEEQYSARREKVYSFMKIPREVEKFMTYGFMQCADSFLFVHTFLPVRFILALWALLVRPFQICFGKRSSSLLKPAEICDLLKGCILIVCSSLMSFVDTSMMYHLIKSQSVIKLYIFYNMLEVGDRLFSAFGQDVIDSLFWTSTEPRDRRREHLGTIPHLLFAIIYVFLHALLVLCQATTLNVAINSSNKALLTIMISNNFVELKGSVFKKFDKNNLFQVACSDVRERFHLFVLLFIVVLQTMKEYAWKLETLWVMVPDCVLVMMAEVLVDWIKHAFITRFNELPVDVYGDYTLSLAYDLAQTRQKNAFTDHSDLVARRMGFIPLPLGVVMIRVLATSLKVNGLVGHSLATLGYLTLSSVRVLNNLVILAFACILIDDHQKERQQQEKNSGSPGIKDSATSPSRPPNNNNNLRDHQESQQYHHPQQNYSAQKHKQRKSVVLEEPSQIHDQIHTLGTAPIFSNSTVNMNDVCLNEEMLRVGGSGDEGCGDDMQHEDDMLIHHQHQQQQLDVLTLSDTKKRAESEPSIPTIIDSPPEILFSLPNAQIIS